MNVRVLFLCAVLGVAGGAALVPPHVADAWARPPQHPQPGSDPIGESIFPPELIMQHQRAIGLDEAQKNFVRSEISKAQARFTELQWQLQDNMETLAALLKQNPADEQQVLGQLEKVLGVEREIKRAQLGLMVRIKNRLTPEQQARLRELRSKPNRD